ncbi:hypothetical protein [Brevibacillus parabrevis]|uniref:hypothetical protein n=1 Tax=Brevibacillus parabrevis TaxID=54914 RepID=UPI002853192A|nr:hypothetical protein [Brevibacillus parabrevis]MDR4997410.1 hypothetical protein [Brevibacillus parabrevis]
MKNNQIEAHYEREEQDLKLGIQELDAAIGHLVRFNFKIADKSHLKLEGLMEIVDALSDHKEKVEQELYCVRHNILDLHMR